MSSIRLISDNFTDQNYFFTFETDDHAIHDYRIILSGNHPDVTKFISSDGDYLTISFEKNMNKQGDMHVLKILEYGEVVYIKRIYLKADLEIIRHTESPKVETKTVPSVQPVKEVKVKSNHNTINKDQDYMINEQELINYVMELFNIE